MSGERCRAPWCEECNMCSGCVPHIPHDGTTTATTKGRDMSEQEHSHDGGQTYHHHDEGGHHPEGMSSEPSKRQLWEVRARHVSAVWAVSDEEYAELGRSAAAAGTSWTNRGEAEALRLLNNGKLRPVFGNVSITYQGIEEFPPKDTETRKQIGCMLNLTTPEAAAVLAVLKASAAGYDMSETIGGVYRRIEKLQQAEQ